MCRRCKQIINLFYQSCYRKACKANMTGMLGLQFTQFQAIQKSNDM